VEGPSKEIKRILVTRLSAIGDTVHSLCLAPALKRLVPGCFLGWVVEEAASPLIIGNPMVDWCRIVPKGYMWRPRELASTRRALRAQGFEASIDPQSLTKSSLLAYLSGASIRVGFARGKGLGREMAPFLNNTLVRPGSRHVVRGSLELLKGLGLDPPKDPPPLALPEPKAGEKALLEGFLEKNGLLGKPYFLFAPGSGQASKRWPLNRYMELGAALFEKTGRPSLIALQGEAERAECRALINAGPVSLAPDLSILGVCGLIRQARLFVGPDSFAGHAAAGMDIPTVMLFSVSDPERVGPLNLYGRSVYQRLTLAGSARARARLSSENMERLDVKRVEAAVLKLYGEIERGQATVIDFQPKTSPG
jgi:ADP-heptose:LPS heptosyltransferase